MNTRTLIIAFCLFALAICLHSCSGLKNTTGCGKTLPVTFIAKGGYTYTLQVPFCDTVYLGTDKGPTEIKAVLKKD